ncbi:homeobox protein knotted-1-like 1 [Primulina eburnea]|uniref:homeobox protein knotted-1-like 1 n=1 Tax=Primulina eburnea TaxID=1245227 RepID=UPI003C6CB0A8
MERKWDCEDPQEDAACGYSAVVNDDHYGEKAGKEEEDVNGDIGLLKREISCHALYESLVQSHLECLKLCCNLDNIQSAIDPMASDDHQNQLQMSHQSELDQFMEAYCMALKELKGSMEEPQQESMAFINYMYSQLKEVVGIPSSPTLSPTK